MILSSLWLWSAIKRAHLGMLYVTHSGEFLESCRYALQPFIAVCFTLASDCRAFGPQATACRWRFQRTRPSMVADGTQGMDPIS